jgi:hypothetical protein
MRVPRQVEKCDKDRKSANEGLSQASSQCELKPVVILGGRAVPQ